MHHKALPEPARKLTALPDPQLDLRGGTGGKTWEGREKE